MSASPRAKSAHAARQQVAALPGYYGKGEPYLTLFSTKYNKPMIDKLKRPKPRKDTALPFTNSGTVANSRSVDFLDESGSPRGRSPAASDRLSRRDSMNTSRSVMSSYQFGEVSLTPRDMVAPVAIIVGKGASSSGSGSIEKSDRGPVPNPNGPGQRVVASSAPQQQGKVQQSRAPPLASQQQPQQQQPPPVVKAAGQQFQALEIAETNERTLIRIQETGARKIMAGLDELQLDQVVMSSNVYIDEHQARHCLYLEFFESRGRAFIRSEARRVRTSLHIETSEFVHRLWIRQRVRNCWHRFAAETQRLHLMLSESKKRSKLDAAEQEAILLLVSGQLEVEDRSLLRDLEAEARRQLIIIEADEQGSIKKLGNSRNSITSVLSQNLSSQGDQTPTGLMVVASSVNTEPRPPQQQGQTAVHPIDSAADLAVLDTEGNNNKSDQGGHVMGRPLPTVLGEEGRGSAGSNHSTKSGTGSSRNKFMTRTTANTNSVVVAQPLSQDGSKRDPVIMSAGASIGTAESSHSIQLFVAPAGGGPEGGGEDGGGQQNSSIVVDSKNTSTMNPISGNVARGGGGGGHNNSRPGGNSVTNAPERSAFGEFSVESLKTPNSQNSFHPSSSNIRRDSAEQSNASRSNFSVNYSAQVEKSDNPPRPHQGDQPQATSNGDSGGGDQITEVSTHPQSVDSISTGMWGGPASSHASRPGAPSSREASVAGGGVPRVGGAANQSDWYGDSADSSQLYLYSAHSSAYNAAAGSGSNSGPSPQQIAQIRAMQEQANQRLAARRAQEERAKSVSANSTPPTDLSSTQMQPPQAAAQASSSLGTAPPSQAPQEQGTPLGGSMRRSPSSRRSPQRQSSAAAGGTTDPAQQEMVLVLTGQPPTGRARRATPPVGVAAAQIDRVPIASTEASAASGGSTVERQQQDAGSQSMLIPTSRDGAAGGSGTHSVGIMCTGDSFNSQSQNADALILGGGTQQQRQLGTSSTGQSNSSPQHPASILKNGGGRAGAGVAPSQQQQEVRSGGESLTASPTSKNGPPSVIEQQQQVQQQAFSPPIIIRLKDTEQQTDEQRILDNYDEGENTGIPLHRPPPSPAQEKGHYRRSASRNTAAASQIARSGSRQQPETKNSQLVKRPHSGVKRAQEARARAQQQQQQQKRRANQRHRIEEEEFIQNDDDYTTTTTGSDDYYYYDNYPKYRGDDEEEMITPVPKNPSSSSRNGGRPPSSGGRRSQQQTTTSRSAQRQAPRTPSQQTAAHAHRMGSEGSGSRAYNRQPPRDEEEEYSEYEELRKKHPLHYPRGHSSYKEENGKSKGSRQLSPPRMVEDDIGMLDLYAKVIKSLSNRPSTVELPTVLAQMREPKMRSVQDADFIFKNAVPQPHHSPVPPPHRAAVPSSSARGAMTSPRPQSRGVATTSRNSRPQSAKSSRQVMPSSPASGHPQHQGRTFKHLKHQSDCASNPRSPSGATHSVKVDANDNLCLSRTAGGGVKSSSGAAVLFDMPDLEV